MSLFNSTPILAPARIPVQVEFSIWTGTAIATVASISYFGLLAGPPLIFLTADLVGLRIALAYVCVACAMIGVFAREAA